MKYSLITLIAIGLAVHAGELLANPDPAADDGTKEALNEAKAEHTGDFKVRFIVERDGIEVAGFTAFADDQSENKDIFCLGVVSFDDFYWRVNVNAFLAMREGSEVNVEVEDLTVVGSRENGEPAPLPIFRVDLQSKGPGSYLLGEILGVTLRLVISEAGDDAAATGESQ